MPFAYRNARFFKLRETDNDFFAKEVEPMLVEDLGDKAKIQKALAEQEQEEQDPHKARLLEQKAPKPKKERILMTYRTIRDGLVFTNRRIIAINVQGPFGWRVNCTSLPYDKIQSFSVETAGFFDWSSKLDLWFAGVGNVTIDFMFYEDLEDICSIISEFVLPHRDFAEPEHTYGF